MQSLFRPCLPRRVIVTALAFVVGVGLGPFGSPSTAHADETAGDARARDAAPFVAPSAPDSGLLAAPRGDRAGMSSVIVVPGMTQDARSVTLWDELARPAPAPLPIPVDTSGTLQPNVLHYTRK